MQYTSENGFAMWDLYTKANVLSMSYGAEEDYLRLMPPIISLNEQEVAKVATTTVGDDQADQNLPVHYRCRLSGTINRMK